jgi:putative flippase GtrA
MTGQRLSVPFKFLAVGVANSLVGLLAIYLVKWLLGAGDVLANLSGYLLGLAVSFVLNRGWTFRHSGPVLGALARFVLVFGMAYVFNLATVLVAIRSLSVNPYLAHAIGIAPYTMLFYLGSRYFVFNALPKCNA